MGNDRKGRVILIVIILVVAVALLMFFLTRSGLKHDWRETLRLDSMEPYGLAILHDLLESSTNDSITVQSRSIASYPPPDSSNYLFIGHQMYMTQDEADTLINWVYRGNDAFLISESFPQSLVNRLGAEYYRSFPQCSYSDTMMVFEFYNIFPPHEDTVYPFVYKYAGETTERRWCSITDGYVFNAIEYTVDSVHYLGWADEDLAFWRVEYGEGNIYFNTLPITFTNYFLKDSLGFEYAQNTFSYLDKKPVYFDQFSRFFHEDSEFEIERSPLKYIFDQPALRYAWYVLLLTVGLFVVFRSKRQQRILPIIPRTENTSIEFAKALGTLYYQSNSPKYLCEEMMAQFDNHNRRRYGIQVKKERDEMVDIIAQKTKVSPESIQRIFKLELSLRYNQEAKMRDVVALYEALKQYYKNARK